MTTAVTFWWVRHGPTDAKGFNGWTDVPARLDDTDRLARLSAFLPPDAPVLSSDLLRARATADAIAGSRTRHAPLSDLREVHFGAWEGRTFADIHAEDPARLLALLDTPGDVAPPGGESWNALAARVDGAVDALAAQPIAPQIIIVAHLGVIVSQVARARGQSPKEALGQPIGHLSVTRIDRTAAGWQLGLVDHSP